MSTDRSMHEGLRERKKPRRVWLALSLFVAALISAQMLRFSSYDASRDAFSGASDIGSDLSLLGYIWAFLAVAPLLQSAQKRLRKPAAVARCLLLFILVVAAGTLVRHHLAGLIVCFGWTLDCAILELILLAAANFIRERYGQRALTLVLLTFSVLQCLIVVPLAPTVQMCALAAVLWLALLEVTLANIGEKESLRKDFLESGTKLAATLAWVTLSLWGISLLLAKFPPMDIVDWGDKLKRLSEVLKKSGEVGSAATILLIAVYCFITARHWKVGRFEPSWKATVAANGWIKSASLALTIVSSFSIVATYAHGNDAADGPLEALTEARAQAISDYSDLIWHIRLQLEKQLRLQISSAIYQSLPAPAKNAIAIENQTGAQARSIPQRYFRADVAPARDPGIQQRLLHDDDAVESPAQKNRWDLMELQRDTKSRAEASRSIVEPPRGLQRSALREALEKAHEVESREEELPTWMRGVSKDVVGQVVGLAVSTDRFSFLNAIAENFPMISAILDASFDAFDETVKRRIETIASDVASGAARDGAASLDARLAAGLADLLTLMKSHPFSVRRLDEAVEKSERRMGEIRRAQSVFQADLDTALKAEEQQIKAIRAEKKKAGMEGEAQPWELELYFPWLNFGSNQPVARMLESNAPTLQRLEGLEIMKRLEQAQIADHISHASGAEAEQLRKTFGKEFDEYRHIGIENEWQATHWRELRSPGASPPEREPAHVE